MKRKIFKKTIIILMGILMTSNCMNSSISYAQNVSQKELKQDYKEIVDDFVEMEEYDIKSGKTVSYKMKNYSDDEYFPATNGYKGTLFESNKLPLVEEGSYELKSIIGNDDRNRVTDTGLQIQQGSHIGILVN